jgi:hypothetical protein
MYVSSVTIVRTRGTRMACEQLARVLGSQITGAPATAHSLARLDSLLRSAMAHDTVRRCSTSPPTFDPFVGDWDQSG